MSTTSAPRERDALRMRVGDQEIDVWNGTALGATAGAHLEVDVWIAALARGNPALRGYGTTRADAAVDLMRQRRDKIMQNSAVPGKVMQHDRANP